MPVYLREENKFFLVIKATKEEILTAKINNNFKVYLVKDSTSFTSHLGMITAFFDDHDEPLVIASPLYMNDDMLKNARLLFSQPDFNVYFFDENNREWMGVKAANADFERFNTEVNLATFPVFSDSKTLETWGKMDKWFSLRNSSDDANAYTIHLGERLYPDDFYITDLSKKFCGFNDSKNSIAITSLERDVAGTMQERDIAVMLNRVFDSKCIYVNPLRADTKKELTDILIVTDKKMLFVQAKDSPNTENILRRSIESKHNTIRSHIKKASNQLRGCLTYARKNNGVTIIHSGEPITIPIDGRQLVGLIVVKEMFDDDYPECSVKVLETVRSLELPIVLLDYPQLNILTHNLKDPIRFVNSLFNNLDVALEHEQFPKSVWSGRPQDKAD